jgi:hypothetical protein
VNPNGILGVETRRDLVGDNGESIDNNIDI